jgi:glycosyltransferase involved in cell wall biosynthesis
MGTRISAIICTHNRAPYLSKALSSLEKQDLPKEEYEIIVVDNRSTDNTRDVVGSFAAGGKIRYIHEPVIGLSHARNTGWQNAASPYVAYLDDDAVASRVWLSRILEVFETGDRNLGCVGGRVTPVWEAPRPSWLGQGIVCGLTVIDWSDTPHVLTNLHSEWLAGANIAFPRSVLETLGGFTPHLDRAGERLLSSGDVFLEKQIQNAGYLCFLSIPKSPFPTISRRPV